MQPYERSSSALKDRELLTHPVAYVSWHDARAYAEGAAEPLPTEAERGSDHAARCLFPGLDPPDWIRYRETIRHGSGRLPVVQNETVFAVVHRYHHMPGLTAVATLLFATVGSLFMVWTIGAGSSDSLRPRRRRERDIGVASGIRRRNSGLRRRGHARSERLGDGRNRPHR